MGPPPCFDRDPWTVQQLKKRRDFYGHLLVYVLVNTFLVVIWAVVDSHGFFWPVFPSSDGASAW